MLIDREDLKYIKTLLSGLDKIHQMRFLDILGKACSPESVKTISNKTNPTCETKSKISENDREISILFSKKMIDEAYHQVKQVR